ncbi:MAG: CDP-glycerol glycerophosphotransferase family protein, partial [Ruminococcus sp.]|nr:CDP-glycerol glycerophosphotransferase family protein [Ruminococcus sp.]
IAGCDCLITDYSSTVMEAGIADKLGLIFDVDFEEYKKDRDAYFDLRDDLPFPFAQSNEQLINNIEHFDIDRYKKEVDHFLYDTFGVVCSGNASDQICDLIDKAIEKNS